MKSLIYNLFLLLLIFSNPYLNAQEGARFYVAFYNVENLFDTEDDPATADDEFTPTGAKQWTRERYQQKISDIASVLGRMTPGPPPDVIGICEVENRKVLEDLAGTKPLRKWGYRIIHQNSPDRRGIDVALIYNPASLTDVSYRTIPVDYPRDTTRGRDILYVKGKAGGEELHFFVNHWKSRSGSQKRTEQKRIYSAVLVRRAVDSIFNIEPNAKILIMGDFNDEPTNKSLQSILNASDKRKNLEPRDLFNLMYDAHNTADTGTYSYKGHWNMLDQIIVSPALLNDHSGWHVTPDGGKIFGDKEMLYYNEKADRLVPNKTYGGNMYFGGISDHLPVYTLLTRKKPMKGKKSPAGRR